MAEELAYALVTPHSMVKSRTGNILSRLISRTGLELEAGALLTPQAELSRQYANLIVAGSVGAADREDRERLATYVRTEFIDERRVLLLVFRGEDAVSRLREVVGITGPPRSDGPTLRDTYGEYVTDKEGALVFFEPAVIIGMNPGEVREHLELWAAHAGECSPARHPEPETAERTLVLIKPDNFRFPNIRPGAVMDVFSRTGLSIAGFKVHHMSVAEAEAFYGPALPVLEDFYREHRAGAVQELLETEFSVRLSEEDRRTVAEAAGPVVARRHWENLVEFMAGSRPSDTSPAEREEPGTCKIVALVYEGEDAVARTRAVLGPTDPSQAPAGTIRREFGTSLMINAAHASDSPENAVREMGIIDVDSDHIGAYVAAFFAAPIADEPAGAGLLKKLKNLFY